MTATIDHPCFVQPADKDSRIWRYMDFTKFVYLVARQSLFFCRSDRLGDPFEGSCTKMNVHIRPAIYKHAPDDVLRTVSDFARWLRSWTYVNCWHMSQYESAAMWKLYSKSDEAIAIQTTYQKLLSVLPAQAFIGLVTYIDYETELMPEGNSFYPFVHKRKSFEHEREVRAVIQEMPHNDKGIELRRENPDSGMTINVTLEELIQNVYVAPTSAMWYFDLVQEVMRKYHISRPVIRSSMDDQPVY